MELWPVLSDLYGITPLNFTRYSLAEIGQHIDDIPNAIARRGPNIRLT